MSSILVKIKRINNIVKHLTLLLKSFKSLLEIIFYIFLMFYIGHDKINSITTHKIEMKEINYDVTQNFDNAVIENLNESTFYVDPFAITIILLLIVLVGVKINNLINKNK